MGTTISKGPITTKSTYDNSTSLLRYGVCEMQGWRRSMEDASMAISNIDGESSYLFGIMDGHGGPIISKYVAYNFKDILLRMDSFRHRNYEQALMETFLKLDELLKNEKVNQFLYDINFSGETKYENYQSSQSIKSASRNRTLSKDNYNIVTIKYQKNYINIDLNETTSGMEEDYCDIKVAKEMGTTANILLINNNNLYCANCGDSLSVLYRNGQAIKLNQEHKTTLKSEYERITKCGGHIINNRIEGKLNLTRAIGDLEFKESPNLKCYDQSVIASPEITKIKNIEGIEFIIMGCDGLWDCVEPQKLCETISRRIKENVKLSDIIGDIFDTILSKSNNSKKYTYLTYSSDWN